MQDLYVYMTQSVKYVTFHLEIATSQFSEDVPIVVVCADYNYDLSSLTVWHVTETLPDSIIIEKHMQSYLNICIKKRIHIFVLYK